MEIFFIRSSMGGIVTLPSKINFVSDFFVRAIVLMDNSWFDIWRFFMISNNFESDVEDKSRSHSFSSLSMTCSWARLRGEITYSRVSGTNELLLIQMTLTTVCDI